MPEKYLTAKELAQRWRFANEKPIYAMKEEIGYTRIGGKVLFPVEKIEAYEQTHTIEPEENITT